MAIDAVYFCAIRSGSFQDARAAALALAQHGREHYPMIERVDVASSIDGGANLLLIYRLDSLAGWETAMAQFQEDEAGQELAGALFENSHDRQWHFYRIEE